MLERDKCTLPWASCELLVAFKFAEVGYAISTPVWPQPYDIVVDTKETPTRLLRVQVKKGRYKSSRLRSKGRGDRECFQVMLTRRAHLKQPKTRLHATEFDYLVVVCSPTQFYVVPVDMLRRGDGDELLWHLEFKPWADNGRKDSAAAANRWLPYLNQFVVGHPLT